MTLWRLHLQEKWGYNQRFPIDKYDSNKHNKSDFEGQCGFVKKCGYHKTKHIMGKWWWHIDFGSSLWQFYIVTGKKHHFWCASHRTELIHINTFSITNCNTETRGTILSNTLKSKVKRKKTYSVISYSWLNCSCLLLNSPSCSRLLQPVGREVRHPCGEWI